MSKLLVCVPFIVNVPVGKECIEQLINKEDVTVILCSNGGSEDIKTLLQGYKDTENVILWDRPENVYVTKIWDDFIQYFLSTNEWEHLIIMNSDLTLSKNWNEVCQNRWKRNSEEIIVPRVSDDKTKMYEAIATEVVLAEQIYDGIAGIFITLTRKQALLISPLPLEVKIWHQDQWIYTILVALGEKVVAPSNLLAYHHHSTSVSSVAGIHDIIEEDKKMWAEIVQPRMIEKIKHLKNEKDK